MPPSNHRRTCRDDNHDPAHFLRSEAQCSALFIWRCPLSSVHSRSAEASPGITVRHRLKGRTFRDLLSTAGVNVGITLLGSVGGILLARNLGAADRGRLVTVLLWPGVFGTLATLGIDKATCYLISRRRMQGAAIMATATRAALLSGTGVAIVGLVVAPLIGRTEAVTELLRVVFVMSPLFIVWGVWLSTLQAVDIAAMNRVRCVQPITYFSGIFALALLGRLTLTSATATFCGSLVVQAWSAGRAAWRSADRSEPGQSKLLRALYRYGVRVTPSTIFQQVNVRLDQLILSVLPAVAPSELGTYAVAASLSWLALPVATTFGSIAFPAVARATKESAIRRIERMSLLGSAGAAVMVLVPLCIVAPFAVPLLFGADFGGAVVCLWILAPGTVCLAMNRVLDNVLQGRGRPLTTAVGEGSAAVLTVVLLVALTPRFGIRGAAVASSMAYLSSTIILLTRLRVLRRQGTERSPELRPS